MQFQFVQADDIGSKAIQLFERGWPSHVDIVWPDGRLLGARSDTIDNQPPGVRLRSANYGTWSRIQRVNIEANDIVLTKFYNFLEAQIGKPYDSTAIAAFPIERDWRNADSWFCSELAIAAVEAATFWRYPLLVPSNEITPRDALLVLSAFRQDPS